MNASNKTRLYLSLSILWMIGIFLFSARPADLSSQDSSRVSVIVANILYSDFQERSPDEQQAYLDRIDYPVRKAAHATEYAVLGILLTLTALSFCASGRKLPLSAFPAAWAMVVIYAATDEFHQHFVPGRACKITDVLIDACGAFLGILLFYLGRTLLLPSVRRVLRRR